MTAGLTQTDQRRQNRVKSDIAKHSYIVAEFHSIKAHGAALYFLEFQVVLSCDCDLLEGDKRVPVAPLSMYKSTSVSPKVLQNDRLIREQSRD
jgi:hypothetical protein